MLFVASAAQCGSASCAAVSSACDGLGDEHVGLVLPSDGLWYVGVDDAALGGGLYTLSATRSICGDRVEAHGEGCDDGNLAGGDGCDARCRVELSVARTNELEPNDDRMSANALGMRAPNGCAIVRATSLPEGERFVRVELGSATAVSYRLRFRLTP